MRLINLNNEKSKLAHANSFGDVCNINYNCRCLFFNEIVVVADVA